MHSHTTPPDGTYLAFDYGSKRIGMAIGERLIGQARPISIVANNSGTPHWQTIEKALLEWQPVGLVVGIPLTLDGQEQAITPHARGFLKQLKRRFELPVFAADERFSSITAQEELQQMRARGQRGKAQKADIDTVAAAIILERWFTEFT